MPEFKYITIFGKYLISTLDEKPKDAYENLSHDGYDRDGPESNLWDLTLIYDSKEIVYHREDWYRGRDELYSLLEF
jgi:hypothetical protein